MNSDNGVLWSKMGPRLEIRNSPLRYADETGAIRLLTISDLNPQIETTWRLTKWETVQIGVWFIRQAFLPTNNKESS